MMAQLHSQFMPPNKLPLPSKKIRSRTYLHEQLKWIYSEGGLYPTEVKIDRSFADVRREKLIVEIQTKNFCSLKSKLMALLPNHPVLVVTTIPIVKIIRKFDRTGLRELSLRKSPQKGSLYDIFDELVYLFPYAQHPHFHFEVLLTAEEEQRRQGRGGTWHRGNRQSIQDRILKEIFGREVFYSYQDYLRLIPSSLPGSFNTKSLADLLSIPRPLAQKMIYFLKQINLIRVVRRQRDGICYQRAGER